MSLRRTRAAAWYASAHPCSHGCNFPKHMERILQLKIISVDLTCANPRWGGGLPDERDRDARR